MQININNISITLTPEQTAQLCKETKQEFTYPIFKQSHLTNSIVKFTSLNTGYVVWKGLSAFDIGDYRIKMIEHTTTEWLDVPYDAKRDLWHGQPVYCWDVDVTHSKAIRFYDVINKCSHSFDGCKDGLSNDYYEAIDPANYIPWVLNAYKTLEGINNGN